MQAPAAVMAAALGSVAAMAMAAVVAAALAKTSTKAVLIVLAKTVATAQAKMVAEAVQVGEFAVACKVSTTYIYAHLLCI